MWSRERAEGFEERVQEAGFDVHYYEHIDSRGIDLWYYKPSALSDWLKSLPKPVALMACDDNQVTISQRQPGMQESAFPTNLPCWVLTTTK